MSCRVSEAGALRYAGALISELLQDFYALNSTGDCGLMQSLVSSECTFQRIRTNIERLDFTRLELSWLIGTRASAGT